MNKFIFRLKSIGLILTASVLFASLCRAQLPAFPSAEGFGANANGGRGGDVYTVVNLNSSGAGSLRYGIENAPSNGRTIVFAVSGYIPISYNGDTGNQTVRIVQNNVTIAGQTAPGDGIGLKDGRILVTGNNGVIRHIRVRHGKYGSAGDCINVESSADDTIIDHVSLMFSTDENISFFNSTVDNFTMQYCTSSWGMERHNAGGLWDMERGSCHHTLWAHHRTRNPKARPNGLLEWINNVTFHWRSEGFIMGDSTTVADWYANIIGCYYLSISDYGSGLDSTPLSKANIATDGQPNFHLYLNDTLIDADGNGALNGVDNGYGIVSGSPAVYTTPFAGAPVAITTDDPLTAYKKVLSSSGALRLDAAYAGPLRDELDDLLIESVENQESILVAKDTPVTTDPDEPPSNGEQHLADDYGISNNGFGTLNSTAYPTDSDGDGMPDFWEITIGSDHTTANHNDAVQSGAYIPASPTGYTLLEEYLHFKSIPHAVISKNTAEVPSSFSVDLRKYTRGFSAYPEFEISSVSGGSYQQFAEDGLEEIGGPIIVFTPTQNFTGRASYSFTVTDADGSTWTQRIAVFVDGVDPNSPPMAPAGLAATAANAQIQLSWSPSSYATSYILKRSLINEGPYSNISTSATPGYVDSGLINGTTYFYVVAAVNAYGEGIDSASISAIPANIIRYQINSGGPTTSPFVADNYYAAGGTYSITRTVNTAGVSSPAPNAVYQSERHGNFSYTIPGLVPGANYLVRLHFAEIYQNAAGARLFNVSINDSAVLSNFDIYATTGAKDKAVVREFTATATSEGNVIIQYSNVVDNALSCGIEVFNAPTAPGITEQPSNAAVIIGNSAAFAVQVTGYPFPSFQWMKNGEELSGQTNKTLIITNAQYADQGIYSVAVYNSQGAVISSTAALTVGMVSSVPTGLFPMPGNNQVVLNWYEAQDAVSYNVKRSNSIGGPYQTLTTVSNTSYTDLTAQNGTTYYYVASAISTGESDNSAEVSALPAAILGGVTLQSEDIATTSGNGVTLDNNNAGYHVSAFANFPTTGGYLQFNNVDGGSGGAAELVVRYAQGGTGTRTGALIVNGLSSAIDFPTTGSWSSWTSMSLNTMLNAGAINTIRFESTALDLGNIDEITVAPTVINIPEVGPSMESAVSNGAFFVQWPQVNIGYLLQYNDNLTNGTNWVNIPNSDETNTFEMTIDTAPSDALFFRLILPR